MVLRDYRPDDFDAICQIDRLCFEPGIAYPPEEIAGWLELPGSFVIVAEVGRASTPAALSQPGMPSPLAGFVLARKTRLRTAHLITIDVLAEYRRSGIGVRLMEAAEQRLRAMGARRIRLEVSVENRAAIGFYGKLGYAIAGRIPRYYLGRVDAFAMQRELRGRRPASAGLLTGAGRDSR